MGKKNQQTPVSELINKCLEILSADRAGVNPSKKVEMCINELVDNRTNSKTLSKILFGAKIKKTLLNELLNIVTADKLIALARDIKNNVHLKQLLGAILDYFADSNEKGKPEKSKEGNSDSLSTPRSKSSAIGRCSNNSDLDENKKSDNDIADSVTKALVQSGNAEPLVTLLLNANHAKHIKYKKIIVALLEWIYCNKQYGFLLKKASGKESLIRLIDAFIKNVAEHLNQEKTSDDVLEREVEKIYDQVNQLLQKIGDLDNESKHNSSLESTSCFENLSLGNPELCVAALAEHQSIPFFNQILRNMFKLLFSSSWDCLATELSGNKNLISQLDSLVTGSTQNRNMTNEEKREKTKKVYSLLNALLAKYPYSHMTQEQLLTRNLVSPNTSICKQEASEQGLDVKVEIDDMPNLQTMFEILRSIINKLNQGINIYNNVQPFENDNVDEYNEKIKKIKDIEFKDKAEKQKVDALLLRCEMIHRYVANVRRVQFQSDDEIARQKKILLVHPHVMLELNPDEVAGLPTQVAEVLGLNQRVAKFNALKKEYIEKFYDFESMILGLKKVDSKLGSLIDQTWLLRFLRRNQDVLEFMSSTDQTQRVKEQQQLQDSPSSDNPDAVQQKLIKPLDAIFGYYRLKMQPRSAQEDVTINYNYDFSTPLNIKELIKFLANFALSVSLIALLIFQYYGLFTLVSLHIAVVAIILAIFFINVVLQTPGNVKCDPFENRFNRKNLLVSEREKFIFGYKNLLQAAHTKIKFETDFIIKSLDRIGYVSLCDVKEFARAFALDKSASLPLAQLWFAFRNYEYYICACNSSIVRSLFCSGSVRALMSMSEVKYFQERLLIDVSFDDMPNSIASLVKVTGKIKQIDVEDSAKAIKVLEDESSSNAAISEYLTPFNGGKSTNQVGKYHEDELAISDLLLLRVRTKNSNIRINQAREQALACHKDCVSRLNYNMDDETMAKLAYNYKYLHARLWPIVLSAIVSVFGLVANFIYRNTVRYGLLSIGIVFALLTVFLLFDKLNAQRAFAKSSEKYKKERATAFKEPISDESPEVPALINC